MTVSPTMDRLDEIFVELLMLRRTLASTAPTQFIQRFMLARQIDNLLHEQKIHRGETIMSIKVERLDSRAVLPRRANPNDAGYDMCSLESFTLNPGQRRLFPTGIALEIPEGYVGLVKPRSGLALSRGIDVLGGVIDSGYRGDVGVILLNTDSRPVFIGGGERIAQLLIQPVMLLDMEEVPALDANSERGTGGFGSTGTH